jgi:2-polyprenyl-3-methyl-5-hydroxy-6-metoxy-1,4-benzoquinol methylase
MHLTAALRTAQCVKMKYQSLDPKGIRTQHERDNLCTWTFAGGGSASKESGAMLRPITERLLRNVGIDAGMRVLDLGCVAGDVPMLAAELVGPEGSIVGIDRSQEVLNVAKERARDGGLRRLALYKLRSKRSPPLNPSIS